MTAIPANQLQIDRSEPVEMMRLLDLPVSSIESLNDAGWADYSWLCGDGSYRQVERKTIHDISSRTGQNEVEVILRKYRQNNPDARLTFLLEGVVEPHPMGLTTYRKPPGKNMFIGGLDSNSKRGAFKEIEAWKNQVSLFCEIRETPSMAASALAIHAWYENDQKAEHDTFERYFKPMNFHPNNQVERLMGLAGRDTDIGEVKALALIKRFGTVWAVASAQPEQIAQVVGISKAGAVTFLRKIGRLDV